MATNYQIGIGESIQLFVNNDNKSYTTNYKAEKDSNECNYSDICNITETTNGITVEGKAIGILTITVSTIENNQAISNTCTINIINEKNPSIRIEEETSIHKDIRNCEDEISLLKKNVKSIEEKITIIESNIEKLKEVLEYLVSKC